MILLAGILLLGVLIFVHELGHFAVAKMLKVKVLAFSLGFGPVLWSRQGKETEYRLSAIPLGGYVKMLGEGPEEEGKEPDPEEAHRSFAQQSVGRRMAIVVAGPLMNLALPFVVLPLAFMVGMQTPVYLLEKPCVGHVVADSFADNNGFETGDCIRSIAGNQITSWEEANKQLLAHTSESIKVTVTRDGDTVQLPMTPSDDTLQGLQSIGLLPQQPAVVGSVQQEMPAAAADLQPGDRILAVAGQDIRSWYDLKEIIQAQGQQSIAFRVKRGQEVLTKHITPQRRQPEGPLLIGIAPRQEQVLRHYAFGPAVVEGAQRSHELIALTGLFLQKLFTGQVSTDNIGGPIMVVQIAGQAAQTGLATILSVLAFLSIQLGILNLLPVPVLDGGHLLFMLVELVRGKALSLRAREMAQQVGMALLLMLMVLAFYNDIMRFFGGGM